MKERKTIYRLPPCPPYDVEGTESWLGDMAARGWFLAKDGFFAGVAAFERGEPKTIRYRLEGAPKKAGLWDDNGGEPDWDAKEMNADFGWEYVTRRGQFYIYRSDQPGERELNTDPAVQAIAIREVERRQRGQVFYLLYWLFLYPLLRMDGNILLTAISIGTPWMLGLAALFLWFLIWEIVHAVHLGRLRRKLKHGGGLNHGKDWRQGAKGHYLRLGVNTLMVCAAVVLVGHVLLGGRGADYYTNRPSTLDYPGDVPFATLEEIFPGLGASVSGKYQETSDPLAPVVLEWGETAWRGMDEDQGELAFYDLYYYELRWGWAAKRLYTELVRRDQSRRAYVHGESFWKQIGRGLFPWLNDKITAPIEIPGLEADGAVAYPAPYASYPTVVLRRGNRVVRATFHQYQTSQREYRTVEPDDWVIPLAESLK